MTDYEHARIFWSMITVVVATGAAIIALLQAAFAIYVFRSSTVRRKREATIHYVNDIRKEYRPINNEVKKALNSESITTQSAQEIYEDVELRDKVAAFLGLLEHLAAGANMDVFDTELIHRTAGTYLINVFNRWWPYMEWRRQVTKNPELYSEYPELIKRLKRIREKADKKGQRGSAPHKL